jgi:acetyl esterase/lipase
MVTILLAPVLTLPQTPSVARQSVNVDGATAYMYKTVGDVELRLYVFKTGRPDDPARKATIVFFGGGGWTQESVAQFAPQAKHLAERGMVGIVADYRVFGRHHTSPFEAMADAKSALRWVRAHAAQLAVDANRIAAAGGSAGGHIALSAAVFESFDEVDEDKAVSSKPNLLVLFNPAVDTTHADLTQLFGGRGREGSPVHHLRAGLPPTLILHGKSDTTVPYAEVDRYCAEAKGLGNQCQLVGYEGATHGFFNPQNAGGKWYRETLLEADRFLTKIGYLRQPAPTQIP